jgi:hypothetical protein
MKIQHQKKNEEEKNRTVSMIHKKENTTLLAKSFASAIPETPHRKCERRTDNMDSSSIFNTTNSTKKHSVFCEQHTSRNIDKNPVFIQPSQAAIPPLTSF